MTYVQCDICTYYNIYIYRDSRLNRPESVLLASLARQLHQKHLLVNEWLITSLKSMETRGELSITLYLQSEKHFCSVRMSVNS